MADVTAEPADDGIVDAEIVGSGDWFRKVADLYEEAVCDMLHLPVEVAANTATITPDQLRVEAEVRDAQDRSLREDRATATRIAEEQYRALADCTGWNIPSWGALREAERETYRHIAYTLYRTGLNGRAC